MLDDKTENINARRLIIHPYITADKSQIKVFSKLLLVTYIIFKTLYTF